MRLFVALDIEDAIRERIRQFIELMRPYAAGVRWVGAESLHVTLKFIGEQPETSLKDIEARLGDITNASFPILFRGCGFLPSPKSARVFWAGIEAGPELGTLASGIEQKLEPLGIAAEKRGFNPHLTLARAGGASGAPARQRRDKPNQRFAQVQQQLAQFKALEFGTMLAVEFFLYQSQLSNQGSRYSKLARFALDKTI